MKVCTGDLLDLAENGEFDVIVHGCNCQRAMGAGIAKAIKARFPEAYAADRATPLGADKMGTISHARIERGEHAFVVVNAYTQVHWRGRGKKISEAAIARCMRTVKERFAGSRIGYPKIGAGLGGGDWDVIAPLIDEALDGEDHTLVLLG